jgi:hypothetical protein
MLINTGLIVRAYKRINRLDLNWADRDRLIIKSDDRTIKPDSLINLI